MGGTVYAFAGGKGGVGRTAVTANVAVVLQKREYDVAVVDADTGMANLGELLDIRADTGIHRLLARQADIEETCQSGPGGITVVPGERGIDGVGAADPANLKHVLEPLRETHDVVLVDTGAGINHQNLVAYGRADAVVLVTTPTRLAASNTENTVALVDRAGGTVAGLVVTHVETATHRKAATQIAAYLETDLLGTIPRYELGAREPRIEHAPDSPEATAYERLGVALSVYHQTGAMQVPNDESERRTSPPRSILDDALADEQPRGEHSDEQPRGEQSESDDSDRSLLRRLGNRFR